MEENFIITKIYRVILVEVAGYKEATASFPCDLAYNELIFHFSGQTTVFFDDLTLTTKANTVRFLPKGNAKRYDVIRHEAGVCIDVFFETDKPVSDTAFIGDFSKNKKIGILFKKLFATWVSKAEGYYFDCIALLYRIFAEMRKNNYATKGQHLKITPALDMIHKDFLQVDFSLKDLASACNMSESYFQRLFKNKFGISPKKYLIQLKINHACELLDLKRYTITEIAELCNFSDVYFFSRQFKEYIGVSPTQYLKKYKSSK